MKLSYHYTHARHTRPWYLYLCAALSLATALLYATTVILKQYIPQRTVTPHTQRSTLDWLHPFEHHLQRQVQALTLLTTLSRQLPDYVRIEHIQYSNMQLTVSGRAPDTDYIDRFVHNLRSIGLFTVVHLAHLEHDTQHNYHQFTLQARRGKRKQ